LKQGPSSGNLSDINQLAIGSTPGKIGLKKPLFAGLTSPGSSQPQILLEEENFRLGPLQMLSPLHELEGPAPRVKFSPRGDNSDLGNSALGMAHGMEDVRSSVAVGKGSKRLDMPSSLISNKSRRSRAHTIMNSLQSSPKGPYRTVAGGPSPAARDLTGDELLSIFKPAQLQHCTHSSWLTETLADTKRDRERLMN
jgi:hypothetical protein